MRIVRATGEDPRIRLGASPALPRACWRSPRPELRSNERPLSRQMYVKAVVPAVLNHRLIVKAEAEVEGVTTDSVIRQTLERVEIPR